MKSPPLFSPAVGLWRTGLAVTATCASLIVRAYAATTTGPVGFPLSVIARDPYIGAIAVEAATQTILFEDKADVPGYPASCIKLIHLLVMLDRIRDGSVRLTEPVRISAEAARMGGSQVFLREGEVFTVEELLYAMMVQSGNDAAVALALHVAGSQAAFVRRMNEKVRHLGLRETVVTSVHGLPPTGNERRTPDVSSARDLARVGCELVSRYPEALRYTSTMRRPFRQKPKPFEMKNHNRLLGVVEGVDGLKTGWIRAGGYSTVVSAKRDGRYVVVVVLGSQNRETRDAVAQKQVNAAFTALAARPPPLVAPPPPRASESPVPAEVPPEQTPLRARRWRWVGRGLAIGGCVFAALFTLYLVQARRRNRNLDGMPPLPNP